MISSQLLELHLYITFTIISIMTSEKMIMDKLDEIKSELDYIKSHMANVDNILTDDDMEALKQSEEDYKKGKTVKL